ncbi:unnamed protein product [Urochloa decumbens]|uniref:Uncharacterized protein n=1 Tax=Urochloa decumbens TaxID=240449 RepID=A0ABC8ZB36_9POAL
MAQISDVAHALAVFDAARQEMAWAHSGDFTGVPEPMKGAVCTISEVLNEAEMRWVTSTTSSEEEKTKTKTVVVVEEEIKDWLVMVKEVACEMRAMARKELLLEAECRVDDKQSARCLPCLPRGTKTTSRTVVPTTTIDAVAGKLEKLKKQYHERFGNTTTGLPLTTCTAETPPCIGGEEETTTIIVAADVLVRGDDKQRIIDIITTADQILNTDDDDYSPATILPIFGPPCVGKTHLVKSVLGDERFRDYLKVMISMTKGKGWEFIVEEIFRETMTLPSERWHVRSGGLYSTKYLTNLVRDELNKLDKRLLLVLDDLMGCSKGQDEDDVLEDLRRFLYDVDNRVIAIVVTRSEAIAEYMSKTLKPYRLHPMSDDMCWEIIKGTACGGLQQTRTAGDQGEGAAVAEMMGHEIASKCSGLPLAAKALGRYYLQSSSVKPQEWAENPDTWNIRRGGSFPLAAPPFHSLFVFTRLRQSCSSSRLGAESWLSFAYCAFVLPKGKGHSLVARDLLNHWCSLGIATRQRGTSCVSELLDRSLLLRENPSLTVAATLLTWESLIHDFASYHFGNVWVVVNRIRNGATPQSSSANKSISSSRAYMALNVAATLLRIEDLMHDFASYLLGDRLIVVDLWMADKMAPRLHHLLALPAGILALRFEDCRETELSDGEFASAKYACLRLLDLSGCSVKNKKLPESIRHLKQLRYLKAPGIQDQVFPKPIITGLHELRYLDLQRSCQLADLTDAFQRLGNLRHLYLSGCSGLKALPASFGRLSRLELLDLSACSGLESLPDDSFGWLRSLRHLDLAGCSGLKALPGSFERLAGVLWHLDLSRCSGLELLPSSLGGFSELRHLDLSELSGITRFPNRWPEKLVHLDLSGCSELTDMAPIYRIDRLRYLDLSGCSRLEVPSEGFLEDIRRNRKGRASGPKDASLK